MGGGGYNQLHFVLQKSLILNTWNWARKIFIFFYSHEVIGFEIKGPSFNQMALYWRQRDGDKGERKGAEATVEK